MQLPLRIDRRGRRSLQEQVYDQVRWLILSGRLGVGASLPPTRELSRQLAVSRNTVVLAYERLLSEGYLSTRPAAATFVSAAIPERGLRVEGLKPPGAGDARALPPARPIPFRGRAQKLYRGRDDQPLYDFRVGRADAASFPTRLWQKLTQKTLASAGPNLTHYGDPAGLYELREAIARHLGSARGIVTTPEQVIVVAGAQQGLNLVCRLLVRPGAGVVTENPSYAGAAFVFESYGARLAPVAVDEDGIDVARLPRGPVAFAYVTPSHQFPLGMTMSVERRRRMLEWAWRNRTFIVEDDYDSDFRYEDSPLLALKGMDDSGCVIYAGTFSKSIGAGLRMGYLVVPQKLCAAAVTAKALLDNGHPWLDQAVLAAFIGAGGLGAHLRKIRSIYMRRRDCLLEALRASFGETAVFGSGGGMHVVWRLPPAAPRATRLERELVARGVGINSFADGGPVFVHGGAGRYERMVLLGYAALTEKEIREGVARIAATLADLGEGADTRPASRPGPGTRSYSL